MSIQRFYNLDNERDNLLDYLNNSRFNFLVASEFGVTGDGVTDDTAAIQDAIDYIANLDSPNQGGTVYLPSGVFLVSGLVMKPFVTLRGAGRFATVIRLKDGSDDHVITVPDSSAGNGLFDLTLDGNRAGNSSGSGLYFSPTTSGSGDSGLMIRAKAEGYPDSENAYKWFLGSNLVFTNCAEHGIYNDGYGFAVRLFGFETTYNDGHGLWAAGTDCEYSLAYVEKNGKAGIYSPTGANKFSDIKIHWSNRRVDVHGEEWAGFHCKPGSQFENAVNGIQAVNIECQANYGDGFYINAEYSTFLGVIADRNGMSALGSENISDNKSAHFRFVDCDDMSVIGACRQFANIPNCSDGSSTLNGTISDSDTTITVTDATDFSTSGWALIEDEVIRYTGKSGNDLTGVTRGEYGTSAASHSDGVSIEHREWVTEYACKFAGSNSFNIINIPSDFKVNNPEFSHKSEFFDKELGGIRVYRGDDNEEILMDINPKPATTTADTVVRFFRGNISSGNHFIDIHVPNTTSVKHRLNADGRCTFDGAVFTDSLRLVKRTVANLPSGEEGDVAYATDGRKNGEGVGAGTGVLVFYDGSNWIASDSGQTVVA